MVKEKACYDGDYHECIKAGCACHAQLHVQEQSE